MKTHSLPIQPLCLLHILLVLPVVILLFALLTQLHQIAPVLDIDITPAIVRLSLNLRIVLLGAMQPMML